VWQAYEYYTTDHTGLLRAEQLVPLVHISMSLRMQKSSSAPVEVHGFFKAAITHWAAAKATVG
jgi:hypothetical protein